MAESKRTLSVSRAAALCGVGRTTVGYWIRSKKLHAHRVGRNYAIPVEDLLFFLRQSNQKIPPELLHANSNGPIFKSFQNCWQYWYNSDHGRHCHDCIAFKNQLQTCFTVRDSGLVGCSECNMCRYYQETFLSRIQFVHQIEIPAAIFKDLYLWGGNSACARICRMQEKDLIGLGIEQIVHDSSLAKVIEAIRKRSMRDSAIAESCSIFIKKSNATRQEIRVSVYPLREPAGAFLVLGVPGNRS